MKIFDSTDAFQVSEQCVFMTSKTHDYGDTILNPLHVLTEVAFSGTNPTTRLKILAGQSRIVRPIDTYTAVQGVRWIRMHSGFTNGQGTISTTQYWFRMNTFCLSILVLAYRYQRPIKIHLMRCVSVLEVRPPHYSNVLLKINVLIELWNECLSMLTGSGYPMNVTSVPKC
uniref:Uncharacterized protein n=1 Tax=Anopheles maculatus TaxID=74869 RepID=A0A182T2W1_9DIPT